ncbi:Mitochondrial distribution and morphology protein 12 [Yarrowia sp. B02]|nr:Mitochondrial distribution and morphology protein 12 [Yarrowia sp. B02]
MSIDLDWDGMINSDEIDVAEWLRSLLDKQFQQLDLPRNIRSVSITTLSLGTIPPELEIKHISDPFPEFYAEEEAASDSHYLPPLHPPQQRRSAPSTPHINTNTSNPIDRGIASYFHPLGNAPLMSGLRTPLNIPSWAANGHTRTGSRLPLNTPIEAEIVESVRESTRDNTAPRTPEEREQQPVPEDREDDLQVLFRVKYTGDIRIGVEATLRLNYPSDDVVLLPMKLHLSHININSLAIMAYIKKSIYLSVICDLDDSDHAVARTGRERLDIIRDVKIDSEIGHHDTNGAALRNVGKVDRFIVDKIRSLLKAEIAWPSWIKVSMEDEDSDEEEEEEEEEKD